MSSEAIRSHQRQSEFILANPHLGERASGPSNPIQSERPSNPIQSSPWRAGERALQSNPIQSNPIQSNPILTLESGREGSVASSNLRMPLSTCMRPPRISSVTIRDHQRQSEANQRPSEAIRGHQRPSEAIRGNQRPSEAISGNHHTCSRIHPPICDATLSIASLGLSPSIATFQPTRVKNSPPDSASSLR